jgi:hypothetical protein
MTRLFDLHVHTNKGSADSNLSPEDLVLQAEALGLGGLGITEHSGPWDRHEFDKFASGHNVVLIRAMEVETDLGHMLAFGLEQYQAGYHRAEELCSAAYRKGGFVISAHPFRGISSGPGPGRPFIYRSLPDPLPTTPEQAMNHPVFKLVNAIEGANGGTVDKENEFAMKVAALLGLPVTGGSDAHSVHGLGRCVTMFDDDIFDETEFLAALRLGGFVPAVGLRSGLVKPYVV